MNLTLFKVKRYILLLALLTVTILVILAFLPHDKYIRYQMLDVGAYKTATWIYERVNFDETPINIAFFGTSHTMNGIDSILVEDTINTRTIERKHVVNFALPHFGRDMHYTLIKLLLENRSPEMIVLEVREEEARDLHPGTHYLADSEDLFSAPILVNFRYLGNIIRLPLRQLKALNYEYFPELYGKNYIFDRSDYLGAHVNYALSWPNGKKRNEVIEDVLINNTSIKSGQINNPNEISVQRIKSYLEHRANLYYVNLISELARSKDVKLVFVYLPSYGSAEQSADEALLQSLGKIIKPDITILRNKKLWSDLGHFNASGATLVSENIARQLIY